MRYVCADRGSDRCPCLLMEAGQCYTCGMSAKGSAQGGSCDCSADWPGSCPYSEFLQNGRRAAPPAVWRELPVRSAEKFSAELTVLTLEAPLGLAAACRSPGSFVMAEAAGCRLPLSVMSAGACAAPYIRLAFGAAGPKTMALARQSEAGARIKIAGPFANGLLGRENLRGEGPLFIVAKGLAAAPLVNLAERRGFLDAESRVFLDMTKLTEEFAERYLGSLPFERIELAEDADCLTGLAAAYGEMKRNAAAGAEIAGGGRGEGRKAAAAGPRVLLLVSPYYEEKLMAALGIERGGAVTPNHANMCCGEGVCGACSFTDADGVTVRMCKCAG